jgi:hypothetical protein
MSPYLCPQCSLDVPVHVDRCVGCGGDVGFPNVRAASRSDVTAALDQRYQAAKADGAKRGVGVILDALEQRLQKSEAVICKPWGVIQTLLLRDSRLLQTFHQDIEAEARLPEANEFDVARVGVDATFFPYYHDRVRFAALSINGNGSTAYGGGCLVLKEESIAKRATVFQENTLMFVRRTGHPAGQPPPIGNTATWPNRAKLGIAKLAERVQRGTTEDDLQALVLKDTGTTDGDDFIEVHIYGPIHRSAVVRLGGKMPKQRADRVLVAALRRDLEKAGIAVEITP